MPMSAEEIALWHQYHLTGRAVAVRNALVEHYYGLAVSCADAYRKRCQTLVLDDLVSDCSVGLIRAVERFDPGHGAKFSSFAWKLIHGAMMDAIRERDHLSRTMRKAGGDVRHESLTTVLSENMHCDRDLRVVDVTGDKTVPNPDESANLRDEVRQVMRSLTREERLILTLYYGEGMTMKEIGGVLGISESRVSQIHSNLKERLKSMIQEAHHVE